MSMAELEKLIDAEVRARVEVALAAQARQLEAAQRRANDAEQENRVLRWALGGFWQQAMRYATIVDGEYVHRNDLVMRSTGPAVEALVRSAKLHFSGHQELTEYRRRFGPLTEPPGVNLMRCWSEPPPC